MSNTDIASANGVHQNTVAIFATKYSAVGFDYAMNDSKRSGKLNVISDEEKSGLPILLV